MSQGDWSQADRASMARALALAALGRWSCRPNPLVGCVLVRDGRIVGEGWHARAGEPHAEVHALRAAGERARGAIAYVTLEPCAHHGRTPPCAEALIAAGVAEVVAAHEDPDPRVAGQGLARLRAAGIAVRCGLGESEARHLNRGFLSRITRGRPWLRLKLALSLDGRMALSSGHSAWITSAAARADGHHSRAAAGVLLAGIGSVLADDPQLSVRLPEPLPADAVGTPATPAATIPLLLDTQARLPASARLLREHDAILWAHDDRPDVAARAAALVDTHPQLQPLPCPLQGGRIDLVWLLTRLGDRQVNEVHAEAGPALADALLQAELVDELLIYQAGRCLGAGALQPFRWPLAGAMPERRWQALDSTVIDGDLRVRWLRQSAD